MNRKIYTIVKMLQAKGEYGTANAIVDAFNIVARAKAMLRQAVKACNAKPYYVEEQTEAQTRIDILNELFDDTNNHTF